MYPPGSPTAPSSTRCQAPFPALPPGAGGGWQPPAARWLTGKCQKVQNNWGPNQENIQSAPSSLCSEPFSESRKSSPPLATAVHFPRPKECVSVTLIHGTDTAHQRQARDGGSGWAVRTAQHRVPLGTTWDTGGLFSTPAGSVLLSPRQLPTVVHRPGLIG